MKIPPASVDSFIASKLSEIHALLIYGPDNGLVMERLKSVKAKILTHLDDPFQLIDLAYDKVKDDIGILSNAAFSRSLTSTKKLIHVRACGATIVNDLAAMLSAYKAPHLMVFTAGDLPPSSALRKFFEATAGCGAIACYKDDQVSAKKFVVSILKEAGFNITSEALSLLEYHISGDRMLMRQEADKLMTYMGKSRNITINDVENSVCAIVSSSLDELALSVASGNYARAHELLTMLLAEGVSAIAIMRSLARYFMRLYQARLEMNKGVAPSQAITVLSPPVFFKHVPVIIGQLNIWSLAKLAEAIEFIALQEKQCKQTGARAAMICHNMLLKLVSST